LNEHYNFLYQNNTAEYVSKIQIKNTFALYIHKNK